MKRVITLKTYSSLIDDELYNRLHETINKLGKKIKHYYGWVDANYVPSL